MVSLHRERRLARPIDEVWALLADFGAISRWAPNVDHSCNLTEQPDGVGAIRRIQSGGATVVETVETWDPPHTMSYAITGLPPVIRRLTNTWQLEPAGANLTTVRITTEIDTGPRPPQQLVAKAIGRRLGAVSDQMLDGLAAASIEGATT